MDALVNGDKNLFRELEQICNTYIKIENTKKLAEDLEAEKEKFT